MSKYIYLFVKAIVSGLYFISTINIYYFYIQKSNKDTFFFKFLSIGILTLATEIISQIHSFDINFYYQLPHIALWLLYVYCILSLRRSLGTMTMIPAFSTNLDMC